MALPRWNVASFVVLLTVRLQAALWSIISDCDETYNYWEPLHFVLKGRGFQTWEYSPEFGLRSYAYLWLHGGPTKLAELVVGNGPGLFYFLRCLLALVCALLEFRLYKVIKLKCGSSVGNMWLFFQLVSPGMFISSAALLPSSFSMFVTIATMTAWMAGRSRAVIAVTALSGLIGWPFAVIVSIPFVLEQLIWKRQVWDFAKHALLFGLLWGVPIVLIDSYYFGKPTIAALNIVRYNVFTSHGPDLYGVEPASFYVKNLLLNHNLLAALTVLFPLVSIAATALRLKIDKSKLSPMMALWKLSPLYLWLAVFFIQPHKEERFMFPVYPLFSFGGALTLALLSSMASRVFGGKRSSALNRIIAGALFGVTVVLGLSRIVAVCMNYHAPVTVLGGLPPTSRETNLCYGKEWYRFPGSFLLPPNYRVRFIRSSFTGILPAYFQETANGTTVVHSYFNDQNIGHDHMLFGLSGCDYLIDLDTGEDFDTANPEPNYSADTSTWSVVRSSEFMIGSRSSTLARAFYVPFLSQRHAVYGKYNLLKRTVTGR
ncbi:glycosyltransferase [Anopheles darlingi]|uniref:Mannosyltransferase n=1 Tax=Anopheles darlingi TaxID=43151 RepID=W5JS21_ANODA|nr:glycosyltransferase [Anopheles darlingi]